MKNFFEALDQVKPKINDYEILNSWHMIESYINGTTQRLQMGQDVSALMERLKLDIKNQLLELDFYKQGK